MDLVSLIVLVLLVGLLLWSWQRLPAPWNTAAVVVVAIVALILIVNLVQGDRTLLRLHR